MKKISIAILASLFLAACNVVESRDPLISQSACLISNNGVFTENVRLTEAEFDDLKAEAEDVIDEGADWLSSRRLDDSVEEAIFLALTDVMRLIEYQTTQQEIDAAASGVIARLQETYSNAQIDEGFSFWIGGEGTPIFQSINSASDRLNEHREGTPGKRFFFQTSTDCQTNRFELDPESVTASQYEDVDDPIVTAKIFRFEQFENPVYVRQVHRPSEEFEPYGYDFFYPLGDNRFAIYTVVDEPLLVMAMYGHAYYDDWQPLPQDIQTIENPFAGIAQEQFRYQRIRGSLEGREEEYDQALLVYMSDAIFDRPLFRPRRQVRNVTAARATPRMLEQLAFMFNEIEQGRLPVSPDMRQDFHRETYTFIPQ